MRVVHCSRIKLDGRNEVGQHHGRYCRLLGNIRLWAGPFGSGSSADLLAVRIVLSLVGLHLAEFATKEMMVAVSRKARYPASLDCGDNWGRPPGTRRPQA
jgi:hypothetical protein